MADGSLGCLHPSRPLRKAALTTEKPGVCHPGGRHPKTSQWSQSVPPSTTRGKVPSHIFPEMPTPKWLVTRRWTGLGQSPWPHPFLSGFLRRNQAQENSCLTTICPSIYKIHIISWRWTSAGGSQRLHGDRRWPWSQRLLQGLVPWEVTSLGDQGPSVLKTPRLSRQGLRWRENSS